MGLAPEYCRYAYDYIVTLPYGLTDKVMGTHNLLRIAPGKFWVQKHPLGSVSWSSLSKSKGIYDISGAIKPFQA